MATGLRKVHGGFDFSMEEGGVTLKRLQTNLSERQIATGVGGGEEKKRKRGSVLGLLALLKSLRRKRLLLESVSDKDGVRDDHRKSR